MWGHTPKSVEKRPVEITVRAIDLCLDQLAESRIPQLRYGQEHMARGLAVTALEQVLSPRLEAFRAEQFEAERVGEPVGHIECGADR
jgi:hypothetical protein